MALSQTIALRLSQRDRDVLLARGQFDVVIDENSNTPISNAQGIGDDATSSLQQTIEQIENSITDPAQSGLVQQGRGSDDSNPFLDLLGFYEGRPANNASGGARQHVLPWELKPDAISYSDPFGDKLFKVPDRCWSMKKPKRKPATNRSLRVLREIQSQLSEIDSKIDHLIKSYRKFYFISDLSDPYKHGFKD